MIGGRFGKLVVQTQTENYGTQRQWICLCDCGKTTVVRTGHLTSGAIKSCGCGQGRWVHGHAYTREHRIWTNMKARCSRPTHPAYKNYGARGITVCERWLSFGAFLEDMGVPPTDKHELERIRNEEGYNPDNCRWATRTEQCNNRRGNVLLTLDGETKTRTQWARQFGVNVETLKYRLARNMPLKLALTKLSKR